MALQNKHCFGEDWLPRTWKERGVDGGDVGIGGTGDEGSALQFACGATQEWHFYVGLAFITAYLCGRSLHASALWIFLLQMVYCRGFSLSLRWQIGHSSLQGFDGASLLTVGTSLHIQSVTSSCLASCI